MLKSIRMIVTDLDGTLLRDDNHVSEKTMRAFARVKAADILPVIATGRNESESAFAARAIGADKYIIAMNGLLLYDYTEQKPIRYTHMPGESAFALIPLLDRTGVFYQVYADNRTVCTDQSDSGMEASGIPHSYLEFVRAHQTSVKDVAAYLVQNHIPVDKFFISSRDFTRLEEIKRQAETIPGVVCMSPLPQYLEIIPAGADKKHALLELCCHLSIAPSQVMVFGDSDNDIGMIEEGGFSVAPANAYESVKDVVDYISAGNNEDGVAQAIERLLF